MATENRDGVRRLLRHAVENPDGAADDLPRLLAALEDEDRTVRAAAVGAVCAVASARPELGPAIESRLEQRTGDASALAASWISRALAGDASTDRAPEAEPALPASDHDGGAGEVADPSGSSPTASGRSAVEEPPRPAGASEDASAGPRRGPSATGGDRDEGDGSSPESDVDGARGDRSPAGTDAVVENGRFTIELDSTVFDGLEIVDRVATDRHSWTYVGMATVDARRRAVLVRTYRPPRGARTGSFASAFEDVFADWQGVDDHDGVLSCYDYGRRPHPWVVTGYASETLRSSGRLPPETALRVGLDAATALAHAHERGVTHRSLDPRSVALDRRDGRPVGRLLNLGVVDAFRAVDGPLPLDSRYAAPELFDDAYGGVDWLTDVYQLGAVLYTAFTGRPPYEESLVDRGGPAGLSHLPPSNVAEGVPVAADRIVAKAMATHKIARYESADELARDLRSAIDEVGGDD